MQTYWQVEKARFWLMDEAHIRLKDFTRNNPQPFVSLAHNRGITKQQADSAAQKLHGIKVVLTNRQIQFSTAGAVRTNDDALGMIAMFMEELEKVLAPSKANAPARRANRKERRTPPPITLR